MNILNDNGISTPKFQVAESAEEAHSIALDFGVYQLFRSSGTLDLGRGL